MEFEFRKDVTGELHAHFSMGCEAFSGWLLEEVGYSYALLSQLLQVIAELREEKCLEYQRKGTEYNIKLTRDEVEVCDARIDFNARELMTDASAADALDFYDAEAHAICGLDDFEEMLLEWEIFISP